MASAALVLVKLTPPHALAAPLLLVTTPLPRVSPTTVRLGALVVGGRGEAPKLLMVFTSQPISMPASVLLTVPVPPPVTMKELELMTVPLGVVTLMKPLLSFAGTVALIWELEFTMNAALTPLNVTAVAAAKFAPVRMTLVPAAPFVGEKVKSSGGGLVWPSTLLRKTVATFAGSAVKKVKPVSTSICAAEVT